MDRKDWEKMCMDCIQGKEDEQSFGKALSGLINQISSDISDAVTPITRFNVNFVVAVLEAYAQSIRADMPCDDALIENIKSFNTGKITMALPTDLLERDDNDTVD